MHENLSTLQLEYSSLKDKHEEVIEKNTVELSKINHEFTLMCNENEDLKNQKATLEKLVERMESDSYNDDKAEKPLIIDSHIPAYKNKNINTIQIDDESDDENLDNNKKNDAWTEVVRKKKYVSNDNKNKNSSNNQRNGTPDSSDRKTYERRQQNKENDIDDRPRFCHFFNNTMRGCSNSADDCKFMHEWAPDCKYGENCRGLLHYNRCSSYHADTSFLYNSHSRWNPPRIYRPMNTFQLRDMGMNGGMSKQEEMRNWNQGAYQEQIRESRRFQQTGGRGY